MTNQRSNAHQDVAAVSGHAFDLLQILEVGRVRIIGSSAVPSVRNKNGIALPSFLSCARGEFKLSCIKSRVSQVTWEVAIGMSFGHVSLIWLDFGGFNF